TCWLTATRLAGSGRRPAGASRPSSAGRRWSGDSRTVSSGWSRQPDSGGAMRSRLHYLRCSLADYLRYGALPRRLASHALAALARLWRTPLARLECLARAARVRPTVARLLRVKKALDSSLDSIALDAGNTANADLGKGI